MSDAEPIVPADTTVLVTGASGFIAQHIIVGLLRAGYPRTASRRW